MTGHQMFKVFGWYPTVDGKAPKPDGSNLIKVGPRSFVGAPDKAPGDASLDTIEPGDIAPIMNSMDKMAIFCAFVAGLLINNFIISKSVASSSTCSGSPSGAKIVILAGYCLCDLSVGLLYLLGCSSWLAAASTKLW